MMIKYISAVIVICLSLLGLAELIHGINLRVIAPRKKAVTYSIVLLSVADAEQQLTFAAEQQRWLGTAYSDYIIAVNNGLDERSDNACRYIAEKYGVDYCTPSELTDKIKIRV